MSARVTAQPAVGETFVQVAFARLSGKDLSKGGHGSPRSIVRPYTALPRLARRLRTVLKGGPHAAITDRRLPFAGNAFDDTGRRSGLPFRDAAARRDGGECELADRRRGDRG